jgi:DNA-binding response OmpR family regulator
MQVLLISTETDLADYITFILRRSGFSTTSKPKIGPIVNNWPEQSYELVLLTHRTPSDLQVQIKSLRTVSNVPIIALAESMLERETVTLLKAGADLVLKFPIDPQVLSEYCHTLLRRFRSIPSHTLPTLDLDKLSLDPSTRFVHVFGKKPIRLTPLEFRLLHLLVTNRGQVIPSDVIVEKVWGYSGAGNRELVRGLISRLRAKIEPEPNEHQFIHTYSGAGYCFQIEETQD